MRRYLKAEVFPLLPKLKSPKRYRFQRAEGIPQLDNYSCGIFVLMFLEIVFTVVSWTELKERLDP
ncbi:Ulp1 protease family C-terminal catalytic domain-containing protein [Phytophthora infestans]|uniref:Ulp1 protease family C-terminal catalytic domain-containing protein n=1 Tax=Phytophthora infestans TaxID=4787 RepID=A0A8S9TMJ7_PHYIN|nr:Ulp1 protease family C-terminal catalytic domain-containing protein [Phytophthora infestans]